MMIKFIILLIVLPSTLFAETFRPDDPNYVDLVPASFNDSSLCRSIKDQANSLKCKTHVEECNYVSEVFKRVTPFQVKKINLRDNLFAQVEGFEYTESDFGTGDKAEFHTISSPAKLKIYSIFREFQKLGDHKSLISVWDVDLGRSKEIELTPKNNYRSMKIDLSKLNLETDTPVELFGQSVGDVSKDKTLIIHLTPGTYNLVFTFGYANTKASKSITVGASNDENSEVIVLEESKNSKNLNFEHMITRIAPPIEKNSINRFFESKSMSLVQNNNKTDVTSLFTSSPESFLGAEKEDFEPKLIHSPAKLEIQGMCKVSEFKPQPESFPIYSDAGKKKKIGDLQASFNDGASYQYIENGMKSEFKPNIYSGFCTNSEKHLGVQRVIGSEEILSDLGEGPWGKHGWIELTAYTLFGSNFTFNVPALGAVKLEATEKEDVFKFDYYESDGHSGDEVREVKRDSLVGPDGSLKVKIDCDSGC